MCVCLYMRECVCNCTNPKRKWERYSHKETDKQTIRRKLHEQTKMKKSEAVSWFFGRRFEIQIRSRSNNTNWIIGLITKIKLGNTPTHTIVNREKRQDYIRTEGKNETNERPRNKANNPSVRKIVTNVSMTPLRSEVWSLRSTDIRVFTTQILI
jgi:hypothetical protein